MGRDNVRARQLLQSFPFGPLLLSFAPSLPGVFGRQKWCWCRKLLLVALSLRVQAAPRGAYGARQRKQARSLHSGRGSTLLTLWAGLSGPGERRFRRFRDSEGEQSNILSSRGQSREQEELYRRVGGSGDLSCNRFFFQPVK